MANRILEAAKLLKTLDLVNHPERLVTDLLREKVWDKQIDIMQSAFKYRQTLVHTGNSIGKTFIGGRLILSFLMAFSPLYGYEFGTTKVVVVGPKFEQLRKQIWQELQAAFYKLEQVCPIGGKMQSHDLVFGPNWYAGIFAVDKENPEKVQGYHAPNFLAIIEEATAVPEEIKKAIEACATSENAHIVAFCNPIRLSGWMYSDCTSPKNLELRSKGVRNVIQVSCTDTPNYILKREEFPGIASYSWVEEKRAEWGEASPLYQSRILGMFPTAADDALIPFDWVEEACSEERIASVMRDPSNSVVAMDIARQGEDMSVMIHLEGDVVSSIRARRTPNTMKAALMFKEGYSDWGGVAVMDENGLGGGPYDKAKYELHVPVRGFISQRRADEKYKDRFANIKAQAAWSLRERFRDGLIAIPNSLHRDKLKADLIGYRYDTDLKGRVKIIDPDKSPDFGDALIMAHWGQNKRHSNDPFESGPTASSKRFSKEY